MAASWDADLIERVARATAEEVAVTGVHWTFSPVLCIARDLRWGRISETFGEDPFLIGELASAMVRGYQGNGLDDRVVMASINTSGSPSKRELRTQRDARSISRSMSRMWRGSSR